MKTYCSDCGFKIEFVSKKPNFCPNCGVGLTAKKPPPKPTPEDKKSAIAETSLGFDTDDEQEPSNFQSMRGLEYDFEPDSDNSETLGSIFKRASIDVEPTVDAPIGGGQTAKENMDQFKAEAGTLRQKNSE
jgi:hypothetical protein|tara:strand:+ start:1420 stop:1812 length:393 start_codon:yes stop_codon:yes gene_type:complete